jgi:nickel-dependent lactate racemase
VAEAQKLLEANELYNRKVNEASRTCIVLGACGTKQLTINLTETVLKHIPENSQDTTTILCTPEAVELDANVFARAKVLRHTSKLPSAPVPGFQGDFTPQVDSAFLDADLRILIGEVRPHHFLKYSGLCDLVFPGLATDDSINAHLSDRPGLTLEAIHAERVRIALTVENLFALGFVLDPEMTPNSVVFGRIGDCLPKLENAIETLYSKEVTRRADIVVIGAGGTPFDESLARAVEAFPSGLDALKRGGALIVAAECGKGHGGGAFYDWSAERKEPRHLETRLRHRFSYGGYKACFLARILQAHRVYLVSTVPDHYVENTFGMKAARTVNAALQAAQRAQGSDSTISVIPDASHIVPKQAEFPK